MNRSKLNRIWAKDSDIVRRDPGDEKYNQGWVAEIPTYQVLNFLQYKIDMTLLAIAERGIAEWGSDVEYGNGSVAWDESDKTIYIATVGKPDRNKKPSSNPEHWAPSAIQVSRLEFDKITNAINNHIADVTSNPHKVTAGGIGAYTKAEINKIVDTYNALVASHANNKNNPHGTKAVDIGAVPVTGGKYTGEVMFENGVFFDSEKKSSLIVGNELNLAFGEWRLGLGSSGRPQTGKAGEPQSEIITEKTFAEYKAKYQGDYSTPPPAVWVPMDREINIRFGIGETEFFPDEVGEPFYADGGLSLATGVPRGLKIFSPMFDSKEFTLSIQFKPTSVGKGNGSYIFRVAFEGGKNTLYILDNGDIVFLGTTDIRLRTTINFGSPLTTITCVQSKTQLKIFLDGELKAKANVSGTIKENTGYTSILNHQESGVNKVYRVAQYKYWNQALSDKQVSTI